MHCGRPAVDGHASLGQGQVLCYPTDSSSVTTTTTTTTTTAAKAFNWEDLLLAEQAMVLLENNRANDTDHPSEENPLKQEQGTTTNNNNNNNINSEWTMLLHDSFYPTDCHDGLYFNHSVEPGTTVLSELEKIQSYYHASSRSNWTSSRSSSSTMKFTIVVEHPIPHIHNEHLVEQSYNYVASLQEQWAQVFLNQQNDDTGCSDRSEHQEEDKEEEVLPHHQEGGGGGGRRQLVEIANLIAFDGSPQFFPTKSGGYSGMIPGFQPDEYSVLVEVKNDAPAADDKNGGNNHGQKNHTLDYEPARRCRGFLPPTSGLTQFNNLGRASVVWDAWDLRRGGTRSKS